MIAIETSPYNLRNVFSMVNLFTPFSNDIEDILATFDLADLVCIEHVEEQHLQVTFLLSNEVSFTFSTCDEQRIKKAIANFFKFISYDIVQLEMLNEEGLLKGLLKQHINQI
ncbi:hypothetical protein D7X33_18980 [Butyricicoccus sp. 1XD8-22]|nr:hypothetical protein D7X33_18980 [Butyricicoccus sp. 1XD8-22]